jgi:SpoVK/Ycf46/Vps4 family AAA+-type ATPase
VQTHHEELLLEAAASLDVQELTTGDTLRWDKQTWLACERIEPATSQRFFVDVVDGASPAQIGGQREVFQQLVDALTLKLLDSQKAAAYGLADHGKTILMHGPPGCGKTLRARVAAAEVARISGCRCRFAVVNAGDWEDPYVGVTQRNIRECFASLREAASQDGQAVLFIDEIESVGRMRGIQMNIHGDKFLAALLCELDGFRDRAGVVIIAATNRRDLLDPALLERLTDIEISVQRPDMRSAREIFAIHLSEEYPYNPNGQASARTRQALIETAVSRLYAPNGENELCTLRFRDGKTRKIGARELMSGRLIEQICRAARQAAFLRHHRQGIPGLTVSDIEEAVTATIGRLSTTLSRYNVHAYLSDLPQDVDVVAVEPSVRRVPHTRRLMN